MKLEVHNWGERQTVWAFNHFNGGSVPGLGIGNQASSGHRDWTLANNAASFKSRRLYGFVQRSSHPSVRLADGDYPLPAEFAQVDEADDYQLLYHWQIPLHGVSAYAFDGRAGINAFDRVAYYLRLKCNDANRTEKWVWASMVAFTDDATQLGIPGKDAPIMFRQTVDDMNVYASENVASLSVAEGGVVTGKHIATGNVEILPSMFDRTPGLPGLGGDEGGELYDWNDAGGSATSNNYGEWQVSNYGAGNIIFNIGAFYFVNNISIGIGNNLNGSDSVDWTLSWNAGSFLERDLYVLVRPKSVMWGDATQFIREPVGARLTPGESTVLSVVALDATSWQWFKDGVLLKGATQPTLSVGGNGIQGKGVYKCLVSTPTGTSFTREAAIDFDLSTVIRFR